MKNALIVIILCITCLAMVSPGTAPASRYEASTGNPDSCLETPELFIDGENVTGQVKIILKNGHGFVPLRAVAEKLGIHVDWDPNSRAIILSKNGVIIRSSVASPRESVDGVKRKLDAAPFVRDGITYIPVQLIPEIPGCRAIWVEKANAMAVFSTPPVQTSAAAENEMAEILKGYFNTDIHQLPKNLDQIRAIYAGYIHPVGLDSFAENLFRAVTTPTSWGATEYVESRLIAQTTDSAVVYCKVKITDCENEGYLHGLWGFKNYHGKWMMMW
jgi:hypothetical protein